MRSKLFYAIALMNGGLMRPGFSTRIKPLRVLHDVLVANGEEDLAARLQTELDDTDAVIAAYQQAAYSESMAELREEQRAARAAAGSAAAAAAVADGTGGGKKKPTRMQQKCKAAQRGKAEVQAAAAAEAEAATAEGEHKHRSRRWRK